MLCSDHAARLPSTRIAFFLYAAHFQPGMLQWAAQGVLVSGATAAAAQVELARWARVTGLADGGRLVRAASSPSVVPDIPREPRCVWALTNNARVCADRSTFCVRASPNAPPPTRSSQGRRLARLGARRGAISRPAEAGQVASGVRGGRSWREGNPRSLHAAPKLRWDSARSRCRRKEGPGGRRGAELK